MRVIGAHWLSDIMFRFDESNRRLYVILIFTSVLLHEQPIAFLAACLVPRPARASRSRVGCGHAGAVSLYRVGSSCAIQTQGGDWYVFLYQTAATPFVVFVRPFRTRTESYTVLSLALALLL